MLVSRFVTAALVLLTTAATAAGIPATPNVGDRAPDFQLVGTDGKRHTLSEFRGKSAVVLAWYPKALTGGCTSECRSISGAKDALGRYQVQVFGISVDTPEENKRFSDLNRFNFVLLSDPEKKYAHTLQVLMPDERYANRWTYIIDRKGVIREIDRGVRPATHGLDLADKLDALKIPKVKPAEHSAK